MKKAIIVSVTVKTRLVIDSKDENHEYILYKAEKRLSENFMENLPENLDWEDDTEMPYKEEKDVPVLFHTIKNKIGWGKWCDVTNGNHYALNEGYRPSDTEVFYCTENQASELGI
jgi:hypothetical protein